MPKKFWVVGFVLRRSERADSQDRLCGWVPVFETKKAAVKWADGRAPVFVVQEARPPDG